MASAPFFFAWVSEDETMFAESHLRNDEEIFDFNVSQTEGDFAVMGLTIENPRVGLLAPGRNIWAWLSYNPDWTETEESPTFANVKPLFFGRLVVMPDDIDGETIGLNFTARPIDYDARKEAAADALRVSPFWDPIWFDVSTVGDPDNVLEARGSLWHVDRLTHVVTASSIIQGEDGTLSYGEDDVFYDSVHVSYGAAPLKSVTMNATVTFDQVSSGTFDFTDQMYWESAHAIVSYTGQGIIDSFPKPGTDCGGGWRIGQLTSARRAEPTQPAHYGYGDWGYNRIKDLEWTVTVPAWDTGAARFGDFLGSNFPPHLLHVPRIQVIYHLEAEYDVTRGHTEILTFTMNADVQSILTDPAGADAKLITMASSNVSEPIDPGGAIPLGTVDNSVYLSSDRGVDSVEYLLMLARANLLTSARCVDVGFDIPFDQAIEDMVTLRKSAVLIDSRMPGGQAAGKLKSYNLSGNGDGGTLACSLVIGCSVGKGGTVTASPGTPAYVEEGYVTKPYQRYENEHVMPVPGEIWYTSILGLPAADDGIDFRRLKAGQCVQASPARRGAEEDGDNQGTIAAQEVAMAGGPDTPDEIFTNLNEVQTKLTLRLIPLNTGPFSTAFELETSDLLIPKTIDLEAGESSS